MKRVEGGVNLKHILCPTDFSEASRKAFHQAIPVARWYEARITALSCIPAWPFVPAGFPEYSEPMVPPSPDDVRAELRDFVRPAEEQGIGCEGVTVEGRPARAIAQYAQQHGVDLIVMGTHGHGGFERLVLGSVTEKVLRKAPCPVLTVGPRAAFDAPPLFARILCALDFSDASLRALDYALSLARAGSALHVVHVVDWPAEHNVTAPGFNLEDFRRHLADHAFLRLRATLPEAARGTPSAEEIVTFGKAHEAILRVATEQRSELIVLGVHGRGALDLSLFGSTAHHVVRGAACPVLTVRG
jgi:nucleotide-binding universal stress UspA family protein